MDSTALALRLQIDDIRVAALLDLRRFAGKKLKQQTLGKIRASATEISADKVAMSGVAAVDGTGDQVVCIKRVQTRSCLRRT